MNRSKMLGSVKKLEKIWDFIIIGGGATGAGCAVDAASRGYDVLLLEQSDFGKGTSSRSTKLIHGGVRYLEQYEFKLVMESTRERARLSPRRARGGHALLWQVRLRAGSSRSDQAAGPCRSSTTGRSTACTWC